MPSDDLAALFFKNKAEVRPSSTPSIPDEVLRKTCDHSVLKLIASKILAPEKAIKSDRPAVMLKWGRRKKTDQGGKIMLVLARNDHDLWKNIPTK